MTVSSWKNAALASLLRSAAVFGQRVVFVPLSSIQPSGAHGPPNAVTMDPFLFGGGRAQPAPGEEPPCRTRRLEPWRRRVREQCRAVTQALCNEDERDEDFVEARDLRRPEWREEGDVVPNSSSSPEYASLASSSMRSLERELDSFFEELFAPSPPSPRSHDFPRSVGEVDPFDRVLNDMLGFSLRAFDQMMSMDAGGPPVDDSPRPPAQAEDVEELRSPDEKGAEWLFAANDGVEEVGSWSEDQVPPPPFRESSADLMEEVDSWSENRVVPPPQFGESSGVAADATPTPERAAEDALDVMVASLARTAAGIATQVAAGAKEDVAEGEEDVGGELLDTILPPIDNLPRRLFQLGQNLLSETHSARRRLSEQGEDIVDPYLQVKERLARRLTEYRTSLLYSPEGNTITLYTTSSGSPNNFPAHPYVPLHPFFGGVASSSSPPLGMGSTQVDECLRSRFDNGDLRGMECHQAVGELLLAVDHGSPESPHHDEFGQPSETSIHYIVRVVPAKETFEAGPGPALVGLAVLFCAAAWLTDRALVGSEEDEEGDDDANEFDYAALPDGDDDAGEGARVFVGVPVQVV